MTDLNRRKALAVVAAVSAVAAVPAMAVPGQAAESLRLWEQWKAQHEVLISANKHFIAVENRVAEESWSPYWASVRITQCLASYLKDHCAPTLSHLKPESPLAGLSASRLPISTMREPKH
jgi:hypothetical protein